MLTVNEEVHEWQDEEPAGQRDAREFSPEWVFVGKLREMR